MGDSITNLYERLVIRDLLSFVTPGAIVVLSIFLLWRPELSDFFNVDAAFSFFPFMLYLLIFGLFYVVGVVIHFFGRALRLTAVHKYNSEEEYMRRVQGILISDKERVVNLYERFVLLKWLCGNNAVAVAIGGILLIVKLMQSDNPASCIIGTLIIVAAAVFFLSLGNRCFARRQRIIEE